MTVMLLRKQIPLNVAIFLDYARTILLYFLRYLFFFFFFTKPVNRQKSLHDAYKLSTCNYVTEIVDFVKFAQIVVKTILLYEIGSMENWWKFIGYTISRILMIWYIDIEQNVNTIHNGVIFNITIWCNMLFYFIYYIAIQIILWHNVNNMWALSAFII